MSLTHYIIQKSSDQCEGVQQVNPRHHLLQLKINKTNNKTQYTLLYCVPIGTFVWYSAMQQLNKREGIVFMSRVFHSRFNQLLYSSWTEETPLSGSNPTVYVSSTEYTVLYWKIGLSIWTPNSSHTYLFLPMLSKRKLILTAQVACILLIWLGVGFATGCGSLKVVWDSRWWNRIIAKNKGVFKASHIVIKFGV